MLQALVHDAKAALVATLGTNDEAVVDPLRQLRLAAQGLGACFCPAMHLRDVRHLLEGPEPILRRLYVPDLDVRNELKLVTNRRMYHPRYLDVFAGILEEEARRALLC